MYGQAELSQLEAKVDGTVGCNKEAAFRQAEPRKQFDSVRGPSGNPQGRMEECREPKGRRDDLACTRKPCRSSHGKVAARHRQPIATAEPGQDGGRKGSWKTTKPSTEEEPTHCGATKREIGRVDIGHLRVVDDTEHTRSPRTLGGDDGLLTKTHLRSADMISFKTFNTM